MSQSVVPHNIDSEHSDYYYMHFDNMLTDIQNQEVNDTISERLQSRELKMRIVSIANKVANIKVKKLKESLQSLENKMKEVNKVNDRQIPVVLLLVVAFFLGYILAM